jgi:hypothetical protein
MRNRVRILWLTGLLAAALLAVWSRPAIPAAAQPEPGGRTVIKNGQLEVMVADTDAAVAAALDLGRTFNSYVLSQEVWDGPDRRYRYAAITFGLDEARFEGLVRALKGLGTVRDESVTGRDVTDERLDLASRLTNLYSTQERLRTFLEQSTNVTETLRVHQELVAVEADIGAVQGQINFLGDRADAATITLSLVPFIPTPTPSPTPTATPTATPTPLPTPRSWRPDDTARVAAVHLQDAAQSAADALIYRTIVCGPWLLLVAVVFYSGYRLARRWQPRNRPAPEPAAGASEAEPADGGSEPAEEVNPAEEE